MSSTFLLVFGALIVATVLAALVFLAQQSGWRGQTEGTVVRAEIETVRTGSSYLSEGGGDTVFDYHLHLEYEFSVNGQLFRGNQIVYQPLLGALTETPNIFNTKREAEEALAAFSPGATVPVYYNESDPQKNALTQLQGAQFVILAGLVLAVLGIMALVMWFIAPLITEGISLEELITRRFGGRST